MKRKAYQLEFISQINRDGSGTEKISDEYLNQMLTNTLMKDEYFKLYPLSLTNKTFIAINFNAFVVKLKD